MSQVVLSLQSGSGLWGRPLLAELGFYLQSQVGAELVGDGSRAVRYCAPTPMELWICEPGDYPPCGLG